MSVRHVERLAQHAHLCIALQCECESQSMQQQSGLESGACGFVIRTPGVQPRDNRIVLNHLAVFYFGPTRQGFLLELFHRFLGGSLLVVHDRHL